MSNSLSQVQAALRGLSANGAAGPLTLNVLHKTEALVAKLLSFDTAKPVSVEVLSAAGNGRASVAVGGLTLDVKASLPLRAGEVFLLRIEKAGANVRLVQPLGKAPDGVKPGETPRDAAQVPGKRAAPGQPPTPGKTGADRGGVVQPRQEVSGQAVTGRAEAGRLTARGAAPQGAIVGAGNSPGSARGDAGRAAADSAAPVRQGALQAPLNGVAGKPRAIAATQALPASLQPAGQISAGQLASLGATPPPVPGAAAKPDTLYPGALPKGVTTTPATPMPGAISSTNGLQGGINTTALIRAVVEALPAIDKRQDGRTAARTDTGQIPATSQRGAALPGPGASLTGGAPHPSAEQVQASYRQFAGGAVEEIAELQNRAWHKPADAAFELPLGEAGRALAVQLYVERDAKAAENGKRQRRYGVRFSMETAETGPVHAEIDLLGRRLQLTLWAEDIAFYERLNGQAEALQLRLAATGLEAGALAIKRGRPMNRVEHWDESV